MLSKFARSRFYLSYLLLWDDNRNCSVSRTLTKLWRQVSVGRECELGTTIATGQYTLSPPPITMIQWEQNKLSTLAWWNHVIWKPKGNHTIWGSPVHCLLARRQRWSSGVHFVTPASDKTQCGGNSVPSGCWVTCDTLLQLWHAEYHVSCGCFPRFPPILAGEALAVWGSADCHRDRPHTIAWLVPLPYLLGTSLGCASATQSTGQVRGPHAKSRLHNKVKKYSRSTWVSYTMESFSFWSVLSSMSPGKTHVAQVSGLHKVAKADADDPSKLQSCWNQFSRLKYCNPISSNWIGLHCTVIVKCPQCRSFDLALTWVILHEAPSEALKSDATRATLKCQRMK